MDYSGIRPYSGAARMAQSRAKRRERERLRDALHALKPYQRPVITEARKAPAGFEIVCAHGTHCFHHIAKSGAEDTYITERCCGCPKTRTLRKMATKEN